MKPTALLALLLPALLLAACATNRTVEGRIAATGESFTGTFDPGSFGGSLEMESDRTRCTGRSTGSETIGTTVVVLLCDDGRAGSAVLLDGPTRSSGTGVLGEDQVSLSILR
jgi:predicted small secreted protein